MTGDLTTQLSHITDKGDALRGGQSQWEPIWTVEGFAQFWSNPNIALVRPVMTDDIVGYWTGREAPVRGPDEYVACLERLLRALPDIRLEIGEYAEAGDVTFVRWIMNATGSNGPFTLTGIDRFRLRDGKVAENYIVFDAEAFRKRAGAYST